MFELTDSFIKDVKDRIHKKPNIKNLSFDEVEEFVRSKGFERYRADQIINDIYVKKIETFAEMKQLPKELKQVLESEFEIVSILNQRKRVSSDGSIKYLFELADGKSIEAVYMPWVDDKGELDRSTLCISSMVGCPVACAFCATGTLGFKRNLNPSEIIEQIFRVEKDLNTKINNVVIMGMGEPLLNYENVIKALRIMTSEKSKILSRRKITLSSSGIAPRIKQLANEAKPVKLAISLHATTNKVREMIMPISKSFDLTKLMDSIEYYYRKTKIPITYEYILFKDLNDSDEDVERLAKIAKRVPSRVNIIPFNDISFTLPQGISKELKPATRALMNNFATKLRDKNVAVIIRDTFGDDIEAACGQLALSEEKNKSGDK